MPDTPRTRSELVALFATNTTGDIGAQDLRDFLASVPVMTRGSGAPTTSPEQVGDRYYDETNDVEWVGISTGASPTEDNWQAITGAGTSFPSNPFNGQRFFRTDRDFEYFYDGSNWLTTQIFYLPFGFTDSIIADSFVNQITTMPYAGTYSFYAEKLAYKTMLENGTTSTNYFTLNFYTVETTAGTLLTSISTQNDTTDEWTTYDNTLDSTISSSVKEIHVDFVKTGTSTVNAQGYLVGRLIG